MASNANITKQGFFSPTSSKPVFDEVVFKPQSLAVGDEADSSFRAVAVALIDYVQTHKHIKNDTISTLLSSHYQYFPQHRMRGDAFFNPVERFRQMIDTIRMPELVQTLAYTLRQLTVEELLQHPVTYRAAFIDFRKRGHSEDLHRPTTKMGAYSIAAMAKKLSMAIKVQTMTEQALLPKCVVYHDDVMTPQLKLQCVNERYFPLVRQKQAFTGVDKPIRFEVSEQRLAETNQTERLNHCYLQIEQAEQHVLAKFDDGYRRLKSMVLADELTTETLLDLYIATTTSSSTNASKTTFIGVEHGHQAFFSDLNTRRQQTNNETMDLPSQKAHMTEALIEGIARSMALGHVSAEQVFSAIDEQSQRATKPTLG